MPHSILFTDVGHIIHGSRATGRLGLPTSHGCIRLSPTNACILFNLVQKDLAAPGSKSPASILLDQSSGPQTVRESTTAA